MAADQTTGGQNHLELFAVSGGTTIGSSIFILDQTVSTQLSRNESTGLYDVTLDQRKYNEAFTTFLDTYAPYNNAGGEAGTETITYENNVGSGGATEGAPTIFGIIYLGEEDDDGIETIAQFFKLSRTSGSYSTAGGKVNAPTVVLVGQKPEGTAAVAAATYDETIVTVPGASANVTTTNGYLRVWLDPAA